MILDIYEYTIRLRRHQRIAYNMNDGKYESISSSPRNTA